MEYIFILFHPWALFRKSWRVTCVCLKNSSHVHGVSSGNSQSEMVLISHRVRSIRYSTRSFTLQISKSTNPVEPKHWDNWNKGTIILPNIVINGLMLFQHFKIHNHWKYLVADDDDLIPWLNYILLNAVKHGMENCWISFCCHLLNWVCDVWGQFHLNGSSFLCISWMAETWLHILSWYSKTKWERLTFVKPFSYHFRTRSVQEFKNYSWSTDIVTICKMQGPIWGQQGSTMSNMIVTRTHRLITLIER